MSSTRLSDSSDDDDDRQNAISSVDYGNNWDPKYPHLSSSDEEFEVVDSETPQPTHNEKINYRDPSSNFYSQTYDKYEQEPSYSLSGPSDFVDFNNVDSNSDYSSNKKHSKKKKSSKNSRASSPSQPKKSNKRKHNYEGEDYNTSGSKRHSTSRSSENNKKSSKSKSKRTTYYSGSSESGNEAEGLGYKPQFSQNSSLPDISDDNNIPSFSHYGSTEDKPKSQKVNDNKSFTQTSGLKIRLESSNKGNLLMEKMGYKKGEGLGKHAQGRVEPVELSKPKGRRGLGHTLPGLENDSIEWDPSLEDISEIESIQWLENPDLEPLDFEVMIDSWLTEGPKNLDIESMTEFIDEEVLSNILKKKSIFDNLTEEELQKTVLRTNPFETLRKGIFMNRAALKMANIDSAFDFMFTKPRHRDDSVMVTENDLLYFADVCAGPGGFSEYILWRNKWRAKGIGFTLKGDCDFKLQNFYAGTSETFEPYYGVKDDGNIYDPDNIKSLTEFVMKVTNKHGVHFMMADGGFSVKGQENIQELLSKQLYLCQFLVALCLVREEGHFVCKLFDLFSPFSVGLVYLMYRCFDKICIFKPNTSRPANSERYIICKHKRGDVEAIKDYLYQINVRLWELGPDSNFDIHECVPVSVMTDDEKFFCYMRDSNNRLGNKQIVSLDKIAAFFQNSELNEPNQNILRKKCLDLWKIPFGPRRADQSSDMDATKTIMKSLLNEHFKPASINEILNLRGAKLTPDNLKEKFGFSILDFDTVTLGSEKPGFILGLGKNRVYQWGGARWEHEDKLNIELPPGTLLYGEFVPEYRGTGMRQKKVTAFHIIDGISICYEIISNQHYRQRLNILNLFTTSLKKWNNNSLCPIRVKTPTEMKDLFYTIGQLDSKYMKSGSCEMCLECPEHQYLLQVKGICFIRTTREPWRKHLSKKTNYYFYYNSSSKESLFEKDRPKKADASTIDSLKNQVIWTWEQGVGFKGEDRVDGVLHKDDLYEFIQKKSL